MSWASRRQFTYTSIFLLLLIVFVGIPAFFAWYEAPTCIDGIKNGSEQGIDCGGSCPKICAFQAIDPIVLWSRFFEIDTAVYSLVALIENPNQNVSASNVPYRFKLRDQNNILITEEVGSLFIPPKRTIPIFVTGIRAGERIPRRVEFEFLEDPVWVRTTPQEIPIAILNRSLTGADVSPRLQARLKNTSLTTLTDVEVVALLFDIEGNALHTSRTVIDTLQGDAETSIIFTWPQPFDSEVARIDLISVRANEIYSER